MLERRDLRAFGALLSEALRGGTQAFAFFLGAGCSISSGILPASTLCLKWIRELKRQATGTSLDAESWYSQTRPGFDKDAAGIYYAQVIQERFPNLAMRRLEVQRFVSNKDPGYGYVTLAGLMSSLEYGPRCNVTLTTNFDDLLYDALNLYYNVKPLVIAHDDLAKHALPDFKRALIIKLHGDALLAPKSTAAETSNLSSAMSRSMSGILQTRGLIFMGYSGGDESIASALKMLPPESLPYGIYWVNKSLPSNANFARWLEDRGAIWVPHTDFDAAMMVLSASLGCEAPSRTRFMHLMDNYEAARQLVERKLQIRSNGNAFRLRDFADKVRKALSSEPASVPHLLDDASSKNPNNAELLGFCAQQKRRLKDYDGAGLLYKTALEIDPDHVANLCHYSSFILDIDCDLHGRKDQQDVARALLTRACASDPHSALALGAYASFLWAREGSPETAEEFYQRALQADPGNAETLASYANFLWKSRGQFQEALEYYELSCSINPASFRMLANYAQLLFIAGKKGRARDYATTALLRAPSETVRLEAAFYLFCNDKTETQAGYLRQIRSFIDGGVRSLKWDLSATVERAERDGHEQMNLVKALAAVISNGASPKGLGEFSAWAGASRA